MTCTLYSLCHTALEFERSAGDAAGKNLALLIEELLEEFRIFVIDLLDSAAFETTVFFLFNVH